MPAFNAATVLSRSFSIWLKNLIPFTILTLVVYSPLIIYTSLLLTGDLTTDKIDTWSQVERPLGFVLNLIATAALTYGTFQQLRGRPAGISESIGVGLKRMFPVLAVGILAGICTFVWLVPSVLSPALALPGLVGVVMVACILWVAVPVAVVEQPGVINSLKRSAELTKGSRWHVFGILFALGLINVVAGILLAAAFMSDPKAATVVDYKVFMSLALLASIMLGALQAVASAVGYHDLRQSKEGVGIEELARVFE